jgi:hypothetical protein
MADSSALITELSRRLRDPNNERHARSLVRDVLTQCQRVINIYGEHVTTTASFTTTAGRTLYATSEVASNVAKIAAIRYEGRELLEVGWRQLVHADPHWLRNVGTSPQQYARIGGNLFALVPAGPALTVSVVYVTTPADLTDGVGDVALPDEQLPALLDMGELVLTARTKNYKVAREIGRRLAQNLQLENRFNDGPGGRAQSS